MFTAGAPGSVPGWELRSCKPHGTAKREKKKNDVYLFIVSYFTRIKESWKKKKKGRIAFREFFI